MACCFEFWGLFHCGCDGGSGGGRRDWFLLLILLLVLLCLVLLGGLCLNLKLRVLNRSLEKSGFDPRIDLVAGGNTVL